MRSFMAKALLVLGVLAGLLQAATVSGVVTDSVSGSKVDSVRVRLMSGNTTVASDTTNAEGVYSFATVDTGSYTIRASKTNYVTKSVNDTVKTGDTAKTVNIAIAAIVRTTVGGTVTDSAAGTALAGAIVRLQSSGGGGGATALDTTGADGKFSFADVATGTYTVRATLADYVTKSVTAAVTSAAVTADIALVKTVSTTVSGTVTDSAAGTALAGAIVRLQSAAGGGGATALDTTGADGKFSFADVISGNYTVRATLADYVTKSVTAAVTSAAVTADIALVKTVSTTVSGTVTDSAAGTALAGAIIRLQSAAGGGGATALDTTGADGKYSFANVITGTYTVRATLADYVTKSVTAEVASAAAVTADVALVKTVTAAVSGTVTDSAAGTKIAGAIVQLRTGGGGGGGAAVATDTTGADGAYSFPSVATGTYSVRVSAAGYVTKTATAAVPTSAAVAVDVALVPVAYGTIIGKVTADSLAGAALSGVTVILSRSGAAVDTATTDAEGKYSFDKVETVVAFTLRGSKTGYTAKSTNLTKREGADTVNFFLAAIVMKDIKVIVLKAADSSALAGASVSLTATGEVLTGTTDASGKAVVKDVVQGTYTVAASAAGYTPSSRQLTVNAASADSVLVYLAASTTGTKTLTGTITDSTTGAKLAGVAITARVTGGGGGGGGITLAAITGADGAYIIVGLPITATAITFSASLDSYRTASRSVTLGVASTADTTKADAKLLLTSATIAGSASMQLINNGHPFVNVNAVGQITLYNFTGMGMVQVIGLNGKLINRRTFTGAGTSGVALQPMQHSNTAFILKVSRSDGAVVTSKVVRIKK